MCRWFDSGSRHQQRPDPVKVRGVFFLGAFGSGLSVRLVSVDEAMGLPMNDLRQRIREEMVRPVVAGYRWAALAFMAYLLALLPVYLTGPIQGRRWRILATLLAAGVLGLCHALLRWVRMDLGRVQLVVALGMASVLGQILTNLVVLGRTQITSDVMLWIVAGGLVFRGHAWFLGALGTGLSAWVLAFLAVQGPTDATHWIIGMMSALVVASIIHGYLARIEGGLEEIRVQDRIRERTNEQLIEMLGDSLENIKTLRGLIPICAQCKKMRDDQGYWQQVEHYLDARSEAQFTHGICPDCAAKFREEFR